jgi:hypothetical protein
MQNQQAAQESLLAIAQLGFILFLLAAIALITVLVIRTGVGRRSLPQDERSWLDYGSLFVVVLGIVAVIIGFLSILLFLDRFTDVTQAIGFLTALFGAIVGLVGTYFGIKSSSDARQGAQDLAANGRDTTQPLVSLTTPPDRDVNVSPDIHPTATFSKAMDSVSINPDTFKLLSQGESPEQVKAKVPDGVVYDEATRVATFTPDARLQNGTTYGATITASVKDEAGNTLAQDHTWHFTVRPKGE